MIFSLYRYAQAEKHFDLALALVHERNPVIVAETWGVLLNNLGHTHRKLKNYDRALEYHLKVSFHVHVIVLSICENI